MTWPALEHERRSFQENDPHATDQEAQYMSKGWLIKARFPSADGHNVSWFWVPVGNCTACRFFVPTGSEPSPDGDTSSPPGCTNPNAAIRAHLYDSMNANTCRGFTAGGTSHLTDVMIAADLADGEPSQPVEILQKVKWSPWQSHQAHAQQEAFLAMARANDYGQPERGHRQDLGDIEA